MSFYLCYLLKWFGLVFMFSFIFFFSVFARKKGKKSNGSHRPPYFESNFDAVFRRFGPFLCGLAVSDRPQRPPPNTASTADGTD